MWRLIVRLPERQRAVLVLRYYEDLDDAAIAEILDCSAVTVRTHAMRGLATLRERHSQSEANSANPLAAPKEPAMNDLDELITTSLRERAAGQIDPARLLSGATARGRSRRLRRRVAVGAALATTVAITIGVVATGPRWWGATRSGSGRRRLAGGGPGTSARGARRPRRG